MDLKHLHLHVSNRPRAEAFYEKWFGMKVGQRLDGLTFLNDGCGFDLALMDDASPAPMPAWFHFGFRLASADAVVSLHERMLAAGVRIAKPLAREEDFVSYRCTDPDGYAIEIYWEMVQ